MEQTAVTENVSENPAILHREADISAPTLPQAVESLRENIPRLGRATDAAFIGQRCDSIPIKHENSQLTLDSTAQDVTIRTNEMELGAKNAECQSLQETVSFW
jgi:hypothetical protein